MTVRATKAVGRKSSTLKKVGAVNSVHRTRKKAVVARAATDVLEGMPVPFDENLLERARTQWQFGDWASLIRLEREIVQHHPERARLALLVGAACAQLGQIENAHIWLRLALDWGCNRGLINRVLISGVHNSLGRAAAVSGLDSQHAWGHFRSAISTGMPGVESDLLLRARVQSQLEQLPPVAGFCISALLQRPNAERSGLFLQSGSAADGAEKFLALAHSLQQAGFHDEADSLLGKAVEVAPNRIDAWTAYAENAMQREDFVAAILRWQTLAVLMGAEMPHSNYERLSLAYTSIKGFPQGEQAEEVLRGDQDKHLVLKRIHKLLVPENYLEIGVQTGRSLALAECLAIGVDPMPQLRVPLGSQTEIIEASSDDFFAQYIPTLQDKRPDLVFIDGMHLFEFALRDFINVERCALPHTLVVIDDILPGHPAQADRNRHTRAWTGDVWKLHAVLQTERPDLHLLCLDAFPTGLLLIAGLNSESSVLQDKYDELITSFSPQEQVPPHVIARTQAISCLGSALDDLVQQLRHAREFALGCTEVQVALKANV